MHVTIFYAHTGKLDPFNILGRITLYYIRPLPKSIGAMSAADQAASINTAAQSHSVPCNGMELLLKCKNSDICVYAHKNCKVVEVYKSIRTDRPTTGEMVEMVEWLLLKSNNSQQKPFTLNDVLQKISVLFDWTSLHALSEFPC